ncbi:MAG: tyrosine-protein phosphatase [Eubacterium sp.]|nr:tyrosine-protein phosphatase [Eubacterium sp.]
MRELSQTTEKNRGWIRVFSGLCLFVITLLFICAGPDAAAKKYKVSQGATIFFSHRGLANSYPENSKKAEEEALKKGFRGANFDLWPTAKDANGVFDLAVTHDENVKSMTDTDAPVTSLTPDQVRKLRITKGNNAAKYTNQYIMLLDQMLVLANKYDADIQVEMKGKWDAEQCEFLMQRLKEYGYSGRTIIEAMREETLTLVKKLAANNGIKLQTNYVAHGTLKDALGHAKTCKKKGFTTVVAHYKLIDKKLVDYCKKNGVKCSAYVPVGKTSNKIVYRLLKKYKLYSIGTPDVPWYGDPDTIPLQGVFNARDLGGYKTKDGRKVKKKRILRSGELAYMTDADVKLLTGTYGLKQVVDLRYPGDVVNCPDRVMDGVTNVNLQMREEKSTVATNAIKRLELMTQTLTQGSRKFKRAMADRSTYQKRSYTVLIALGDMARKAIGECIRTLIRAPEGASTLLHCVYGKDRCGMMSAMMLLALGVEEQAVIDDYAFSNVVAKMTGSENKMVNEKDLAYVIKMLKEVFGSIDKFFTEGVGISKDELTAFRNMYLE